MKLTKEDITINNCIKIKKNILDELYEEILTEEPGLYNITDWYVWDLRKQFDINTIDKDFPYEVYALEKNNLEHWGDFLSEEFVNKNKF